MADAWKPSTDPASGGQLQGRRRKAASALGWTVFLLLLSVLWGVGGTPGWAEEKPKDNPKDKLSFLVARSSIADPFFQHSVVLMLPLEGEPVVVGLVVNKPTHFTLQQLFPKSSILRYQSENAYLGGPVDMAVPALVFHAQKPPKQAMLLYDDVYLSFDLKFISKLLQDPKQTGDVRLFLGRAQWAPEQLQDEALEGSWYSLRAEGGLIFDHDSEHLWKRLSERARPPLSVEDWMPEATPTLGYLSAPPWLHGGEWR